MTSLSTHEERKVGNEKKRKIAKHFHLMQSKTVSYQILSNE